MGLRRFFRQTLVKRPLSVLGAPLQLLGVRLCGAPSLCELSFDVSPCAGGLPNIIGHHGLALVVFGHGAR